MVWPDWAHRQKLDWKTALLRAGFRGWIEYVEVGEARAVAVTNGRWEE